MSALDTVVARSPTTLTPPLCSLSRCIIDKPCGAVALSTELGDKAQLVLVRDATRGEYSWYGNAWYGQHATMSMLELGWWLPTSRRGLPSLLLADLLVAAGAPANASALEELNHAAPSAAATARVDFAPPPPITQGAALVVVSCASDYANQGFKARVMENRARHLEPILAAWRKSAGLAMIIHSPNGHTPDGSCSPRLGESVVTSNEEFDALIAKHAIKTLYYVGYAANTDMMFGVGGMQRFYSRKRYLGVATPDYYWVDEATIAVESAETLAASWAKKAALAYRQPLLRAARPYRANVVTSRRCAR